MNNNPTMTIFIDGDNIGAFFECNVECVIYSNYSSNTLRRNEDMKIQELQINDWVNINDEDLNIYGNYRV